MGSEPAPDELAEPFDVVVHCAASTKWSMDERQATTANIDTAAALAEVVSLQTRLVYVSTAFVTGRLGTNESPRTDDYHNLYEWSKAWGERIVASRWPACAIVRLPLVIGRRRDGHIDEFNGLYTFLKALAIGTAPALLGDPAAYFDIVPVDDAAGAIVAAAVGTDAGTAGPQIVGAGDGALRLGQSLDVIYEAWNEFRAAHGAEPLSTPPIITPEQWDRFFFPFAREHLSPMQLRAVELLAEFRPYSTCHEPLPVTIRIEPVEAALRQCVTHWLSENRRVALMNPRPWVAGHA
jgi:nucleoside-diphosphate-sugar epimerase